ncbi:MAG: ABC transporter permease [Gemmatimonadales bacterium]
MLWNAVLLALREIRRNGLRSSLTTLGIVIGVAAVIVMVTLGNGATAAVTNEIASLGSNVLVLRTGQRMGPGGASSGARAFDLADAQALAAQLPALAAVAPTSSQAMTAIVGNANWSTSVTGTTNDYFAALDWQVEQGRRFLDTELRAGQGVCILGATVRQELFGAQDPIGVSLRLDKLSCRVVGVLATKGKSSMGMDRDDLVVIPLRAFQRRIAGTSDVRSIQISVREGASLDRVKDDITSLLRERRRLGPTAEDDFAIMDPQDIAAALTGTTRVLTTLLAAVAAVSLLVGGIGIMNIMLVSVTERTREVGIRLAIGALEREVLTQFLVEAVVLASLGGLMGVVVALVGSAIAAERLGLPLVLDARIVMVALLFATAVGILFGFVPARRAASLNPIDALRHE